MHPFITVFDLNLPVYFIIAVTSYIIGILICIRLAPLYGISSKYVCCAQSFIALGIILGSKLLYMLTKLPDFMDLYNKVFCHYTFMSKVRFLFAGYVFYGGLIGAVAGLYIFCRYFRLNTSAYFNILTPLIPFVHCFGRIGCYFAGCCYGICYNGPFSVYMHGSKRFPIQLIEAFIILLLFIFLYVYTKKKKPKGYKTFAIYLLTYSMIRFFLEFLRGDFVRGIFFGLSTSQWLSILFFISGFFLLLKNRCKQ